jgi:hypothetical protein
MIPRFSYECNGKLCQLHPEFRDKEAYVRVKDLIKFLEKYASNTNGVDFTTQSSRLEIIRDLSKELNEPVCVLIQKGDN